MSFEIFCKGNKLNEEEVELAYTYLIALRLKGKIDILNEMRVMLKHLFD